MTVSPVLDAAGRRRSPATMPLHAGRPPRNKGRLYPADPPTVEEIVAVMREASDNRHGFRLRALIVVLWRGGLRVAEALALGERDLDPRRGSLLVRNGKGGRRREIGMDAWGWEQLRPWLAARLELPVGPLFCVIDGPTRGPALVERQRARQIPSARRPSRHPAPLRTAPAAPRSRCRARTRRRPAQRHPAPTRPRQPRHHQHLPARHRHRRDHRHRPHPARADDVGHRRTAALNNPTKQRERRSRSRCQLEPRPHLEAMRSPQNVARRLRSHLQLVPSERPPEDRLRRRVSSDAVVSRARPRLLFRPGSRPEWAFDVELGGAWVGSHDSVRRE